MPEVLQDGGVYFDPVDSGSIAAAVQILIDNKELRGQVAKNAKLLSSNYSWKICSRKTFEFIRDTLSI